MNNYEIISISEDTHEFLLQEPKDVFSLTADLPSTSNNIDNFTIERTVHEKIHKQETWRDETQKSEQAVKPSDNDKRLEVLSCTIEYAIVVLHPMKHNDVVTSIKVRCYDNREKPWSQCIYCIYNEVSNTYSLLQLSDKFQFDQKESIFNCHNPIIENLLRKFCVDSFKYNEEIQFDDSTDIRAAEISRQDPYESDNLSNLTLPNITYDNSIQSFTTNGNQSLSIVTNEHFSQSAKGNNHQQVSLVVDRYEFRPGQLPSDDRSIYSAVIFLLDRSKSISLQSLYKSVTPTIKYLANMNNFPIQILINNLGLEDILCDITFVFNALSTFYPEILFCIISISNIPETNLYKFNQIDTYPSNSSTHKKCMFILYDTVLNNYIPLYLYDNENNEEAKMNLKYDEFSVPILQQFLLKNFTCPNNLHLHVVQPNDDFRVQPATDLLSLGIIGNVNTLSTVTKKSTKTTRENCFPLSRTATAAVAVSRNNEPNTLVKFVQQKIPRDGHCFYWSMILLLELNHMTVPDLRSAVADHVLKSEEMDFEVLCSGTDSNFQEYCYNIKNTNMWADHLEIEAVAQIYNTSIRIVTIEKKDDTISNVSVTETLSGESSFTKCVYLVYIDKNHYEALYLEYDNEPNLKTKKVFERTDQTVRELLYEFFKNKYNYHREIKFFHEKKNDVPSVPVRINPSYIIKNPIRKRRIPNENDKQSNKKTTNTEGSVVKYTMEFQKQPMEKFRARMRSDIEPTSRFNKTGQETQLRKPSYMADRDNNHSLTLLIPKELLTHNLDSLHARITIITRYFNERAYEHPYLVFLVCNQQQIIITNSLYIHFGNQSEYHKLTIDTDGSAKLRLFLVIIKRKLCELKQIKSLTVFNPSNSNMKKEEIPVTSTYSDELIKQYELHKLHLCVTLWKQDSNSGEYHRLDDTPCISELIEEDKDFKVSVATQNLYNLQSQMTDN